MMSLRNTTLRKGPNVHIKDIVRKIKEVDRERKRLSIEVRNANGESRTTKDLKEAIKWIKI